MKYYVVSDVHGYYTYMINALDEAGFFDEKEPCMLVSCGDILDRGQEAVKVVDFMTELLRRGRLVFIHGNHEELYVKCLHDIVRGKIHEIASGMSYHYSNKTWDTLLQISEMSESEAYSNHEELVRRAKASPFYTELLPASKYYYETQKYVFTHGWIPYATGDETAEASFGYDPNWRDADYDGWRRASWANGIELAMGHSVTEPRKTVVCGHWHTSYGHYRYGAAKCEWGTDAVFTPFYGEGILAIDGCTAVSGRVNCVVLEDTDLEVK